MDRFMPETSPDNRHIVYLSSQNEAAHLRRMNSDGSDEVQLTAGDDEKYPQISPNGKWIVFTRVMNGKPTLARIPVEGGEALPLVEREAIYPTISPDGQIIAFLLLEQTAAKMALMPFEGGAPTKIFPTQITLAGKPFYSLLLRFSPDGSAVNFIKTEKGAANIYSQPLDGKPVRRITNFKRGEIFYFDISPDGSRIALARGSHSSDVMLINLPQ
jgi:TolB protein